MSWIKKRFLDNNWVLLAVRLLLGGIFLVSSLSKILNISDFTKLVTSYNILPPGFAQFYGLLIPWAELAVALLLIMGIFKKIAAAVSISLIAGFMIASIFSLASGKGGSCGCFGEAIQLSHTQALLLDSAMLFMVMFIYFPRCNYRKTVFQFSFRSLTYTAIAITVVIAYFLPQPALASAAVSQKIATATNSVICFEKTVAASLGAGKPAFLFFYSDQCDYCQVQKPIIDKIEAEFAGQVTFIRLNNETDVDIFRAYGVTNYPTMFLITGKNSAGLEKQRFDGLTDESMLKDSIRESVSGSSYVAMANTQNDVPEFDATTQTTRAVIVVVDGMDFGPTAYGLLWSVAGMAPPTFGRHTSYLETAVNDILKVYNISDASVINFPWDGDLFSTEQVLPQLKQMLQDTYNYTSVDPSEKLIVISHSWGCVLTYLALSDLALSDLAAGNKLVKPDLYITLSNPLGSKYSNGSVDNPVANFVESAIAKHGGNVLAPEATTFINYWSFQDVISGPVHSLFPGVIDVNVNNNNGALFEYPERLSTTLTWHGYTSLSTTGLFGEQTNNQVLRKQVGDEIIATINSSPTPTPIATPTHTPTPTPIPATTSSLSCTGTWNIGQRVFLKKGGEIRVGSDSSYSVETIVPEDGWVVDVIGGPRCDAYGNDWWDISRANIDGGGTGWVNRVQAEYISSPTPTHGPPQPGDGIEVCDGSNYGQPCQVFTEGKYANLADYSWYDRIESIRFLGSYKNNYHVVLYSEKDFTGDPGHYDSDASTLGSAQQNHVRSLEIYRTTSTSGIELCDGENYSGTCQFFAVAFPEGKYADLSSVGFWDRAKSVKFVGDCVGGMCHAVLFSEKDFQGDPAHFDQDASVLPNAQRNHVRSVSVYKYQLPAPATNPNPANGAVLDTTSSSLDVTFDGSADQFQIHVWGVNHDQWRNWDSHAGMHLDGLVPGQTYFWQAQGKNRVGVGPWSPQWSFTTPALSPVNPNSNLANSQIAFVSDRDGTWEIYVMNPDGSNQTKLTTVAANNSDPAWSPDGSKIAFWSNRDGNYEIYVMNADGSNQTRLTNNPAFDFNPTWSPDGSKIAFVSTRDNGMWEIYVMNADGSNQTQITNGPVQSGPDWSPDGNRIVYNSGLDDNATIYVMNTNGSNQTRLTVTNGNYEPVWSPDGQKIVFTSIRDGNQGIFVMNTDGSNQTRLTNKIRSGSASWSPDGSKIVFNDGDPWKNQIYVMNSNGLAQTNLTNNSYDNFGPVWSPLKGGSTVISSATVYPAGVSFDTTLNIDSNGVLQSETKLQTADGSLTLDIANGTKLLSSSNSAVASISATPIASLPIVPDENAIIQAYAFGPDGAKFDPALTLTIVYDPSKLPLGTAENDLYIAYFDGTQWQKLETTVDSLAKTVTAKVSHFSNYVLMSEKSQPPSKTSTTIVTIKTPMPLTSVSPTPAVPTAASPSLPQRIVSSTTESSNTPWGLTAGIIAGATLMILIVAFVVKTKIKH